jgi:hypothetical protein
MLLLAVSMSQVCFSENNQPTIQKMNGMPLSFTKNMGQWDDRVLFRTSAAGATMWFTKEGVTYQFTRTVGGHSREGGKPGSIGAAGLDSRLRGNDKEGVGQDRFGPDTPGLAGAARNDPIPLLRGVRGVSDRDSIEQLVLTAKFVGANPDPEVIAESQMEYKCNYFLGNEPTKWRTDVPNYEAITLKDIYPGIDLRYSGDCNGQAAYEFIAAPGADIAQIKVEYEGAEETSIDADGRLILNTKWGDMVAAMKSPANGALSGSVSFSQLSEKTIGFEANGSNRQALGTLAVVLSYSTYLGGGSDDYGYGIAVDGSGNAYVTGSTHSSNFPTQNPYQADQGGADAFVTKLSSFGNSLIYSTYLGGGSDDAGYGIAVGGTGNACLTGFTVSSNFPILNPYQTDQDGWDVFVTQLSTSGNSLIYSTYLGGGDLDRGYGIAVDGGGNAYVTGLTISTNFPILNPCQADQGGVDAFVTKFSNSGSLMYSTYLGGGGADIAYGIAVYGSGNAYVTGNTASSNFPTLNPCQTDQGGDDAFVTKLSNSGNSLIYSSYLGGGDGDAGFGIAVDGSGNAYVTGYTLSTNFPILNPYQTDQGGRDAFVTKLSSSGSSLIYSTYLGGGGGDYGYGIVVDGNGKAYVTGLTGSSNFPTLNPYQTDQGGEDAFVTKLSNSGNSLIYSTYLGGGDGDAGFGIAVDGSGNAYVTGYALSTNFPIQNPYQTTLQGSYDAFVTRLSEDPHLSLNPTTLTFSAVQNGSLPGSQSFTITNTGGGTLNWSVTDNATWLDESPASGNSNSQVITVSINTTNKTPGTYNATITVSSTNADNSPQAVAVAYNISEPSPRISLNPTSLSFSAVRTGRFPASKTFSLTNTSVGTLNWSISDDAAWLNANPSSGSSNSATITVAVNTTNLSTGPHNATITVSSSNADNSPQTVAVTYNLSEPSLCDSSTVDPVFLVCPGGDAPFRVRLKLQDGSPAVGDASVYLQFYNCSGIQPCPSSPPFTTVYPVAPSDANGGLTFFMKGGGCYLPCLADIKAPCGTIATVPVKSLDRNGDLAVSILNDFDFSLCNDYNGNNQIDFNDENLMAEHNGHACNIDACRLFGNDFHLEPSSNLDSGQVVTLKLVLSNNNQAQSCYIGFVGFYYSIFGTGGEDHLIQTYPYNDSLRPGQQDTLSIPYTIPGYGPRCLKAKFTTSCCGSVIELSKCLSISMPCQPDASICYEFTIQLNEPAAAWFYRPYLLPNWDTVWVHKPSLPTTRDSIVYRICTPDLADLGDSSSVVIYVCSDANCLTADQFVNEVVISSNTGDVNADCLVNITDVVYIIQYIFGGGPSPRPYIAGDANCDAIVNITDAVYLVAYIFSGGAPPCTVGN